MIKKIARLFESTNKEDWDIAGELLKANDKAMVRFFAIMFFDGRTNPRNKEFDKILGIRDNSILWNNVTEYYKLDVEVNNMLIEVLKNE